MSITTYHLITPLAPSLVNRGKNEEIKSIAIGNSRRQYFSSQSCKRSIREHFKKLLTDSNDGFTTSASSVLTNRIIAAQVHENKPETQLAECEAKVNTLFTHSRLALKINKDNGNLSNLLPIPKTSINLIADLVTTSWDAINADPKKPLPHDVEEKFIDCLDVSRTLDMVLFGRMVATYPELTVTGAVSVSHSIGVTPLEPVHDFFAAKDEFQYQASHMGMSELSAGVFYTVISVDKDKLADNLNSTELAVIAEKYLVQAFIDAIVPQGKSHVAFTATRPALVLAVRGGVGTSLFSEFADQKALNTNSPLHDAVELLRKAVVYDTTKVAHNTIKLDEFVTSYALVEEIQPLDTITRHADINDFLSNVVGE